MLIALAGAALATTPAVAGELVFEPVPVPQTDGEKATWRATSGATLDGRRFDLSFTPLLETGRAYGAGTLGRILTSEGKPVLDEDGKPLVSHYADFTSLLPVRGDVFAVTHFESLPSALYLSRLVRDRGTGRLATVETRPLNLGFIGGIHNPCAGVVTAWGTHLGGEEYPPDVRAIEAAQKAATPKALSRWVQRAARYHGMETARNGFDGFGSRYRPYRYGYPFEVTVRGWQDVRIVRHHAMGRFSHELAYVMPDRRTVYMTDDGDNGGFFMYLADRPGDLSAGRLWAARLEQTSPPGAADLAGNLSWIDLGHARSPGIAAAIERGTTFSDLFETADMSADGRCPPGFGAVNFIGDGERRAGECLKVKPGRDILASRLETRRFAALKGATTEFTKGEGITYDAARRQLYVSFARIERGMEDNADRARPGDRFDRGGPNHIRAAFNVCGMVAAIDVGRDDEVGSAHVGKRLSSLLAGRPDKSVPGNICALDTVAGPDNVVLIPEHDTLIVAEDSGDGHENDAIWAYDIGRKRLQRIMTMPWGAEASGIYWYPGLDGAGWLTAVVQHPFGDPDGPKPPSADPAHKAARIGLIGPFPAAKAARRDATGRDPPQAGKR